MGSKVFVLFICMFFVFVACDEPKWVSSHNYDIKSDAWHSEEIIWHTFKNVDTLATYSLSLYVSTSDKNVNLPLALQIKHEGEIVSQDTILYKPKVQEYTILSKMNNSYLEVLDRISFKNSGDYEFGFYPLQKSNVNTFGVFINKNK